MNWIIIAFQIAVIASVYAVKLTKQGMLLGGIYYQLTVVAHKHPWTEWFLKPLMLCVYCVTGQMALWTLILYGGFHLEWVPKVIDALFFLSLPFVLVELVDKVWKHDD